MVMRRTTFACALLLSLASGCARRADDAAAGNGLPSNKNVRVGLADATRPARLSPEEADAAEPAVAAGPDGAAYVVWAEHRAGREADVMLARLDGEGRPTGQPARVNPRAGEVAAWHGDPPSDAVADDGAVYVAWSARDGEGHANTLYLSASRDGGRSFLPPSKVNDDRAPAVHGMDSLAVAPGGRVYVAWLDGRNVAPPVQGRMGKAHGGAESNREVYFSFSSDGGRTFSPNKRVAAEACPCCKTALAATPDGRVYVGWRQVLPGDFRHIALASSPDGGRTFTEPVVVSDDRWMLNGCAVSGPSLAVGSNGVVRVLWYTAGEAGRPGLYWSESRDGGRSFAPRRALAEGGGRGTPVLLTGEGGNYFAVWEGDDERGAGVASSALLEGDGHAAAVPVSTPGELPAAAGAGGQVFIAYTSENDEGRGVWLVRAKTLAHR